MGGKVVAINGSGGSMLWEEGHDERSQGGRGGVRRESKQS